MPSELITHEVRIPGIEEASVSLGVPATWVTRRLDEPPSFLAHMPSEDAGPFGDNLVVGIERLGPDAPEDLEELQGLFYAQAFANVPDFHAIDDRPLEVAGVEGWLRVSLQTAPPGITAVNRQVFTRRGDLLVTISLTTMALRDREVDGLFQDILDSCTVVATEGDA